MIAFTVVFFLLGASLWYAGNAKWGHSSPMNFPCEITIIAILTTTLVAISTYVYASDRSNSIKSQYTKIGVKSCKLKHQASAGEGDWVEYLSPGVLGFQLELDENDSRQDIQLLRSNGTKENLNFFENATSGFNHLGNKAEWRINSEQPIRLIVKMYSSKDEKPSPQFLFVSRITPEKACVVKIIDVSKEKNANEASRKTSDSTSFMNCLF